MLGGAAAVGICYLLLGWAKEIAGWFADDAKTVRALYRHCWTGADIFVEEKLCHYARRDRHLRAGLHDQRLYVFYARFR